MVAMVGDKKLMSCYLLSHFVWGAEEGGCLGHTKSTYVRCMHLHFMRVSIRESWSRIKRDKTETTLETSRS